MTTPRDDNDLRWTWGICLFLGLVTLLAYGGVFSSEFVYYDDPYYVFHNPQVQAGLTWDNVGWAFTTRSCDNWHPLTWLSLMLDSSTYGLDPLGFHATNLALHIANTILLFLLLQRMTGARWRSAFVAALFAWHPLHVESVAWVAERKDLLSTLLGLLTVRAYVRYAEKPELARYWPVPVLFALGLMAKPMLVTLPFLLWLLDFWPLKRLPPVLKIFGRELRMVENEAQTPFGRSSGSRLVLEKTPLLALSAISSAITLWAQTQSFVLVVPFKERLVNAAVSCLRYVTKMVWPHHLYVNYPYPPGWPIGYPLLAAAVIGGFSVIAVRAARRWPYVFTGWFWFLGTLIPVIGLVQVGFQSMADRYTYVPLVGLFMAAAWLGYELSQKGRLPAVLVRALAVLAVAACIPLTIVQVGYWKNSIALFQHALRLNPNNFVAESNLGSSYAAAGQPEPALDHLKKSAKLNPDYGETYTRIGKVQLWLGRFPDAVASFQTALQHHAPAAEAHFGLAEAFEAQDKLDLAAEQAQAALALEPGNPQYTGEYRQILEEKDKRPTTAAPVSRSHP